MSTNFYWIPGDALPARADEQIHIGLRAGGWSFQFQGYPQEKHANGKPVKGSLAVRSWAEWKQLLASGGRIVDEYDAEHTLAEFAQIVEVQYAPTALWEPTGAPLKNAVSLGRIDGIRFWYDETGYGFNAHAFS